MDQSFKARLKQLIVSHEGYKTHLYTDSVGKQTIGIGYNITDRGMPDSWINKQYDEDVEFFDHQLNHDFEWYQGLCDERRMVLIDMCFMGYKTFLGFKKMLEALAKRDYEEAAFQIVRSDWAEQVGRRAMEDAQIMRTGVLCFPQA